MKLQKGFTLIEIMVTVAIVAILTAAALPSYNDFVRRGNIPDATSELSARRVQAEQYFQDNRTYLDVAGPPAFVNQACVADNLGRNFDFDCDPATWTATTFTIRAIGKGNMAGFVYTIDQNNLRQSPFTAAAPQGWTPPVPPLPNTCWVTKRGGQC